METPKISLKLTIKTPKCRSDVIIVYLELIVHCCYNIRSEVTLYKIASKYGYMNIEIHVTKRNSCLSLASEV